MLRLVRKLQRAEDRKREREMKAGIKKECGLRQGEEGATATSSQQAAAFSKHVATKEDYGDGRDEEGEE